MTQSACTHLSAQVKCPGCNRTLQVSLETYAHGDSITCPGCNAAFELSLGSARLAFDPRRYPDISPDAFTHPMDAKALAAVRKVPGVDWCIRKMMEYSYEKICRVNAMADDVRVTPKTCGYIHDMAEHAAKTLGIPIPDVYIDQDPRPNAYTVGVEFPLISIQSGLIELLNEEELYAVIAHEMGHIKCQHVLYHMLALFLSDAASALGIAGYVILPLKLALLEWFRKSELSADRAALLVTNNRDSIVKLLMKLAGGSHRLSSMIDEEEFVHQAAQFEKLCEGIGLNKFYRIASNITRTHPFPVLRAHEISTWAVGKEYADIRAGNYPRRPAKSALGPDGRMCPHCKKPVTSGSPYCEACGHPVDWMESQYGGGGGREFVGMMKGAFDRLKIRLGGTADKLDDTAFRKCPRCGGVFHESAAVFCPNDGTELVQFTV